MTEPAAADVNARIAGRVRSLRNAAGMSLADLAAATGVSRSMISLIERGEANPTASVLERIASGMGMPLAGLFSDPGPVENPVSRPQERSVWRDPQSGYERINISPPGFPSPIDIVDVTLPPGTKVSYETAARPAELHEQIWVQSGRVDVTVGDTTHRLSAGDCLAVRLDHPTAFQNPTRKRARYVVVITRGATG